LPHIRDEQDCKGYDAAYDSLGKVLLPTEVPMQNRPKRRLELSTGLFCALMILNGGIVGTLCYAAVVPMAVERAEELGSIEASQEVTYLYGLIGLGLLVSTLTANAAVAILTHVQSEVKEDSPKPPSEK
jgi:hypothetical protein